MPVIAVINRKGGSGKSTASTHLAAWCAQQKLAVMLGDIDRQQSTRTWLRLRGPQYPAISPWAMDNKSMLRPPTGVTHVILDTPGGLHGLELARVVMFADAILVPVCNAVFDRESAAACFKEMKDLPRVLSGRCKVGAIATRLGRPGIDMPQMQAWAQGLGLALIGGLSDRKIYVDCAEKGLTVFDCPAQEVADDLREWQPILDWLKPVLSPNPVPASSGVAGVARPIENPRALPNRPVLPPSVLLKPLPKPLLKPITPPTLVSSSWASKTLGAFRPNGLLRAQTPTPTAPLAPPSLLSPKLSSPPFPFSSPPPSSPTAQETGLRIPRFLQRSDPEQK